MYPPIISRERDNNININTCNNKANKTSIADAINNNSAKNSDKIYYKDYSTSKSITDSAVANINDTAHLAEAVKETFIRNENSSYISLNVTNECATDNCMENFV